MDNKNSLLYSGFLLLAFFISGILDILDNFMVQLVLVGTFVAFIVYLFKVNKDKRKKNLP